MTWSDLGVTWAQVAGVLWAALLVVSVLGAVLGGFRAGLGDDDE